MATVFDMFTSIPYIFLEIGQSHIRGDVIKSERELRGVFKDKSGSVQSGNMEALESSSTLHVKPSDFPNLNSCSELVGQGVRINGQEYAISGATAGTNFDNGEIEHYRLTLEKSEFSHE